MIRLRTATRWLAALVLGAGVAAAGGCSTNPATGERIFTGALPVAQEEQIGKQSRPEILAEFGGEYPDEALQRYVQSIGELVAATSERTDVSYTFTVLNSDVVNAFAVPGGYIYITRGLLALANNEAEIAGVLAHEVGHIVSRHSAQRATQSALAGVAAAVLGVATGSSQVAQMAQTGGMAVIQSYSREQEFEADTLGVRYLSRAGYDPSAMSSFLASLNAHSNLEAKMAGGNPPEFNIMSTHPRTQDRVQRAVAEAGGYAVRNPMLARDIYLQKIDGIVYGDAPEQGFVRGRDFVHPTLGFRFRVPEDFRLMNGAQQVVAKGSGGAVIVFDAAQRRSGLPIVSYLRDDWAAGASLQSLERITVNGMEAATALVKGTVQGQPADLRLVAIAFDGTQVFRFMFVIPSRASSALIESFQRTTYSFQRLSAAEAARYQPKRLDVVPVGSGDGVSRFVGMMNVDSYPEEQFRVLNGLLGGEGLLAGQKVKIVTE